MAPGGFFALGELYPEREVWFKASGADPVVAGDLLATVHRIARGLETMTVHTAPDSDGLANGAATRQQRGAWKVTCCTRCTGVE
jgi:hypothetical protein